MILYRFRRAVTAGLLGVLLVMGCAAIAASAAETPGERFDKAIKEIAAACASRKLAPNEVCGEVTKLKPADPLATPEGRFAHSIKIPNPVPEDSGYKPGMTPQEYFDHLCKTEAGEFIYKTVENVEGIYQMRPRKEATDYELEHLYALEDPYGHENAEAKRPEYMFVEPNRYKYLERSLRGEDTKRTNQRVTEGDKKEPVLQPKYERLFGYNARDLKSMQRESAESLKSRYGFTWRGITRPHDRELGIAGGELIIIDLQTNEVLGVRRGYIRSGGVRNNLTGIWWLTGQACPTYGYRNGRNKDFDFSYWFIGKVLRPKNYELSFKELTNAK